MRDSVERKIENILQDRTHGAAFLAREALATMKFGASSSRTGDVDSFLREMARLGCRLISLRPSMSAPIANGIVRAFDTIRQSAANTDNVNELKEMTCLAADRLLNIAEENSRRTATNVARAIRKGATVLTHSYSETCLRALLACAIKGLRVFVTESRPLCEGKKMASHLHREGVPVTLITDAEAGHFIPEAQMVLVGADTVLPDGSVVNKMGTYLVALAANDSGVPFCVACDSWKFRIENGNPELEEMSPEELTGKAEGIPARNIYFDITPARLIGSLITEDGIMPARGVSATVEEWRGVLQTMCDLAQ